MAVTKAKDIMTDVVQTLQVGDTLARARNQIERGGIHHLPVVDAEEHVIGLITYHRILEAWISHGDPDRESLAQVASDIPVDMLMEKDVLTVDADATAAEAARIIDSNRFGCLPVTHDERLVGIITAADLVHLAVRYLEQERD
jgi:CBS domain-containing protein